MSLISDTSFLIHSMRLSYLREVDSDPYGPRLITLAPTYNTNSYIISASLNDIDRWPELAMPSSPQLSDDERPSGFPGARLKYSTTIMGGRTGGLGLAEHKDDKFEAAVPSSAPEVKIQEPTVAEEAPVAKVVQFIPKFKGAAEMERRRRMRMAARRAPWSDFAASRSPGLTSDSVSEVTSVFSATASSVPISQSTASLALPRARARLSPVSEGPTPDRGPHFEMLTPGPGSRKPDIPARNPARIQGNHASSSTNPFAELYAAVSGRGEGAQTNVQVYVPSARAPRGQAMDLSVRKDATVEEVIGFALWTYWEEGWLPKLDEGIENDEDKKATRLSAVGWTMRIAEEDGEVDDDFPPPDRVGKIAKFNADAYAVLEATPAQIQQNRLIESNIQRHPSRVTAAKKVEKPSALTLAVAASSALPGSGIFGSALGGSVPFSTSLGPSFGHGPQILLRIKVEDGPDAIHIGTTISVSAGIYMQEVLEKVCSKTKLDNPENYALLLETDNTRILIPLDRTVASLGGKRELVLIRRTLIGDNVVRGTGKTTDPNALILKRMSDTPEVVKYSSTSAIDYNNVYKQYVIYRKMPMLVAKQERTLAFDGLYIHILPTANKATKAVFDSGKHLSYHIRSIADCQQSTKSSALFKLVLGRSGSSGKKRYDYEAESPKHASEIVAQIWSLKNSADNRVGTRSLRRSRHVG
ncbi:stress-activated map kinase interacting protein 1-domain-containing protein [Mycena amicta]|nr:stress-activated map kinase interacting protein 1-domain-containing protein [Mycena amicta]